MSSDIDRHKQNERSLADIEQTIDEKFRDTYTEAVWQKSPVELLLYGVTIVFFLYHLWYSLTFAIPAARHGIIHLAMVLALWGIFQMLNSDWSTRKGKAKTIAYAIYSVVSLVPLYIFQRDYQSIVQAAGIYSDQMSYLGVLTIVLVFIALLHISRLISGIVVFGLIYSYFGPYMPGILAHRGLTPRRIITMNTVEMQGLFGTLLQISATWVVIFLLLAGLMEKYGGMASFIKGMTRIAARSKRVEIGQVAVAASMFMGSINGSTAANTATTGAFTIPLMKENGYRAKIAAAIEAVASCGGQVLPPIMGAGAFLMAELIEPNYADIVIGAAAPAILFFLTVAVAISLSTSKDVSMDVTVDSTSEGWMSRIKGVAGAFEYIGMFAVLLYWLISVGADPMVAGFYAIVTLVSLRLVQVGRDIVTNGADARSELRLYLRESIEGIRRGAEATLDITILLASLGIVIRALIVTGFAQQVSSYLVSVAGGSVIVMLFLAMAASIAFGMGMSTTAAYMIVAVLVAPSLVNVGVQAYTAHMFVFYFAIVSNITPPIALSVIIAQGISGSEFWDTAIESLRIGFPMFLLPFSFFFNESLLYPSSMTPVMFVVVFAGFVAVSIGLVGRISGEIPTTLRPVFLGLGLGTIFLPTIAGQALLGAAIFASLVYFVRPTAFGRGQPAE
jgi:TRAP transporter 4TM/12TM fusion protein